MKKRIEGELISIAHRILKLKDKEDVSKLQLEAKNLYEQLTLLKFYEENVSLVSQEISKENFESKVEKVVVGTIDVEDDEDVQIASPENINHIKQELFEQTPVLDNDLMNEAPEINEEETHGLTSKEHIMEMEAELMESIPEINKPLEQIEVSKPINEEIIGTKVNKQISIDDVLVHDYEETSFAKKEDNLFSETISEVKEEIKVVEETPIEEPEKEIVVSQDAKPLAISLNDRIAFEKNLFNGNTEDLNRVLSQLNTFTSLSDAKSFLLDFVKPDYNNWKDKEEFERMFLDIIENKFT